MSVSRWKGKQVANTGRPQRRRSSTSSAASQLMKMGGDMLEWTPAAPYVKAGRALYKGAQYVRKLVRNGKRQKTNGRSGGSKWNNTSTGVHAGKFKKPKRVKDTLATLCLSKGYKEDYEEYGRIEDPNTVYIGHSTKHVTGYAKSLVAMFVRKLFKTAGYPIGNRNERLDLFGFNNADGFKLEYYTLDPSTGGLTLHSTHVTTVGETIDTVINGMAAMQAQIVDYISNRGTGVGGFVHNEPFKLLLFSSDRNVLETNWRMASCVNLTTEYVVMYAKSTLVVQNRSAGANAGATDKSADRVDNQPLEGKIYEFSQATSRVAHVHFQTNERLNRSDVTGLNLVRAGQFGDAGYQNSPDPKLWTNCNKTSKILLQPGTMKTTSITHVFKGKFMTVLRRMRAAETLAPYFIGGAGKFQWIQLEESLRTQSENPVTVQYERRVQIGCYSTKSKTPALTAPLVITEINNF